jgi:hypothetical protein
VDITHPPSIKNFDRVNYQYPSSKKSSKDYDNNISVDDGKYF